MHILKNPHWINEKSQDQSVAFYCAGFEQIKRRFFYLLQDYL